MSFTTKSMLTMGMVTIISVIFFLISGVIVTYKGSCSDFEDYSEASKAYRSGLSRLDGDGDGIPCEELYNNNK